MLYTLIFISNYVLILLVGINHLNLTNNQIKSAMFTSTLMSTCTFINMSIIGQLPLDWKVWIIFVVSGSLGIGSSMKLYPWIIKKFW